MVKKQSSNNKQHNETQLSDARYVCERIQHSSICVSDVRTVSGNASINYRGASSLDSNLEACVKDTDYSVWDDDWAE